MAMVKLGDVAIEKRETWTGSTQGVPIVGLEHLVPGEITLSSWDSDTDNTFSKMFRKDQVLLGRRRVYLKKAVIAPFDGICSGDITVIEAIPGKISSRLLPFIIQNERFFDYAMQGSAGSLSPRVKWEHLKDYEFNIPDYEEQESLANKLWSALKLKESYHSLLFATDEMVKSRFIEMFGNLESKKRLGDVASYINGFAFKPSDWSSTGLPIIRIQNLTGTNEIYNYYNGDYPDQVEVNNGDILISWSATLGVYVWTEGKALLNQHIFKVSFDKGYINRDYFIYAVTQKLDEMSTKTHGTTMRHIVKSDFDNTIIPFPSIEGQDRFALVAKQADKSKFELKQAIEKIDKVMRALLQ